MIALPEMLVTAAEEAGIKVPDDLDNYERIDFPHWYVFCEMQLGQPMPDWECHWTNAKIIAAISIKDIKKLTAQDLIDKGFQVGYPTL